LGRDSNLILVLKEFGKPGDRLGQHLGHLKVFLGIDEGEPVPMVVLDAIPLAE
jgi:hypothetical protein